MWFVKKRHSSGRKCRRQQGAAFLKIFRARMMRRSKRHATSPQDEAFLRKSLFDSPSAPERTSSKVAGLKARFSLRSKRQETSLQDDSFMRKSISDSSPGTISTCSAPEFRNLGLDSLLASDSPKQRQQELSNFDKHLRFWHGATLCTNEKDVEVLWSFPVEVSKKNNSNKGRFASAIKAFFTGRRKKTVQRITTNSNRSNGTHSEESTISSMFTPHNVEAPIITEPRKLKQLLNHEYSTTLASAMRKNSRKDGGSLTGSLINLSYRQTDVERPLLDAKGPCSSSSSPASARSGQSAGMVRNSDKRQVLKPAHVRSSGIGCSGRHICGLHSDLDKPGGERGIHAEKNREQRLVKWKTGKAPGTNVAIVKESRDPRKDFKESMTEMIKARNVKDNKELEELLGCYLMLNDSRLHQTIIDAFVEVSSFNVFT